MSGDYLVTKPEYELRAFSPFFRQDVAYSLTTTLEASLLPSMETYVDLYLAELTANLLKKGETITADFKAHFDLVWHDDARVILTGLWKRLSHEQIRRYANAVGPSMITKSLDHVRFIVRRVHQLLREKKITALL